MKHLALIAVLGIAVSAKALSPVHAEPVASSANLTPVGAERMGNAEGTIPEWTGGISAPPAGWKHGDSRPDPYGDEKPLFVIDANNADAHAAKLSAGQLAILKRYDGYTMPVYPSHRSCAYPGSVYEATKANTGVARIDEDGKLLAGKGGFLFPEPQTGAEAVWNHLIRYQGVGSTGRLITASPKKNSGNFSIGLLERTSYSRFHDPERASFAAMENVGGEQITEILSPNQIAGSLMLIREAVNGDRETWRYMPGQRRVRRLPDFRYDNP
ncbi:MAG: DUF1329 domain-containing protein, partial [Nitratireductor sp.]